MEHAPLLFQSFYSIGHHPQMIEEPTDRRNGNILYRVGVRL